MSPLTRRRLAVFFVALALSAAAFIAIVIAFGGDEASLRATLRLSGRLSFVLFLPAFLASALHRTWPGNATRWLKKYRGELGLAFAGAHLAHLGLISWLATLPSVTFPPLVVGFGGFGFVIISALVVTSFPAPTRWLGARRWRALHRFGVNYIAVIFAYDWFRSVARDPAQYMPLALLLIGAVVLRIASKRRRLVSG